MDTIPRNPRTSARLTPDEREIIIGCTDAEDEWTIYADVLSRFGRRLVEVARAWDRTPREFGGGVKVELPLRAIRLARPPSARRSEASRRALQGAHGARTTALRKEAAEGVAALAKG